MRAFPQANQNQLEATDDDTVGYVGLHFGIQLVGAGLPSLCFQM